MSDHAEVGRCLAPRLRAWRVGIFIALIAPLVGAMLVLMVMVVANGWGGGDGGQPPAIVELLQAAAMFAVFGYIFGLLPALLSALWLGRRTALHGGFGYVEAIATAAAATVVGHALLGILLGESSGLVAGAVAFAPIGVASGIVCRVLLGALGWAGRAVR